MRSSLSRLAVLAVCLAVVVAAAVPTTAGAAGGYHMTRPFSDQHDTGRAVGKLCTGSKFGNWRWRASIGSGDLQVSYRWIEPVFPDGKARHLDFTYIGGQIVEDQETPALRELFVKLVKRALNRITVKYSGGQLVYEMPNGTIAKKAFKPARGC
jgi:hypothetical protein